MKISSESKITFKKNVVIKTRVRRTYIPYKLDLYLRKSRTKIEIKILKKLQNIISVPFVLKNSIFSFTTNFIKGTNLSKTTNFKLLVENIVKMHEQNIVHNDLNYKNIIVTVNSIYIIDFGLAEIKKLKNLDKIADFINLLLSLDDEDIKTNLEILYSEVCNYDYFTLKKSFLALRRYI